MLFTELWNILLQSYASNLRDLCYAYGGEANLMRVIRLYVFDDNEQVDVATVEKFKRSNTANFSDDADCAAFFSKRVISRIKYTNEPVDTPHRLNTLVEVYARRSIMVVAMTLKKDRTIISTDASSLPSVWIKESLFRRHLAKLYVGGGVSDVSADDRDNVNDVNLESYFFDVTGIDILDYDSDNDNDDVDSCNDHDDNDDDNNDDNDDNDDADNNDDNNDNGDDNGCGSEKIFMNNQDKFGIVVTNAKNNDVDEYGGGVSTEFDNYKSVSNAKKLIVCPTARYWFVETYKHFFNKIFASCRKVKSETAFYEMYVL